MKVNYLHPFFYPVFHLISFKHTSKKYTSSFLVGNIKHVGVVFLTDHWLLQKVLQSCMDPRLKTTIKTTYNVYTTLEPCIFAYAPKSPEYMMPSESR